MIRAGVLVAGFVLIWQAFIWATDVPAFMLPPPGKVAEALWTHRWQLLVDSGVTLAEILLGLLCGVALGCGTAIAMVWSRRIDYWLRPITVVSQALPVFALAPLLVLWMGYGMSSKIAMATLIIYFPVAATFFDGLRRTSPDMIDLARTMTHGGKSGWPILAYVRIPAALPALAAGIRVAAAVAPIGAIVGEWVGSNAGLGRLMMYSAARNQTPTMFAALVCLAVLALMVYFFIDWALKKIVFWTRETRV